MSLVHVLSFHQSSMLSMRSHSVSSSTPYISYLAAPSSIRPSRLATSIAALFSPLPYSVSAAFAVKIDCDSLQQRKKLLTIWEEQSRFQYGEDT